MEDKSVQELSEDIVYGFARHKKTLSAAESCTGGLIASCLVSIPHASRIFKGSAVCYCDEAKIKILGVPKDVIEKYFAESSQCAEAMSLGAVNVYDSDISVSATGFLDANVAPKPQELAGTVYVGVSVKNMWGVINTKVETLKLNPQAPRNENRKAVAQIALRLVLNALDSF